MIKCDNAENEKYTSRTDNRNLYVSDNKTLCGKLSLHDCGNEYIQKQIVHSVAYIISIF